ncbi:hypothetical protein [Labedella phragmitis]|uniref:hypothetical protein n=1 Tax=Labedella phragmitis TaxID=2498849 RepID=UPI001FB64251|nr:hypothetical protein [Labedella phragmitis]
MSSISPDDIRWNDEARAKILDDSDRVLREAVLDVAGTHADGSWEDAFAELNARLKDRFIDFEPGPDLRRFAEAIVADEIEGVGGGSTGSSAAAGADSETTSSGSSDDSTAGDGGGAYADRTADQIAADAGLSEPATPETDGSAPDSEAGSTPDSDEGASVTDGNATSDITKTGEPTD